MTKLRTLLAGVVIAALAYAGFAVAQTTLTSRTLTGNEAWQVGEGIGGASFFVTAGQMRNSQGVVTTATVTGTFSSLTNTTASLISTAAATGAMVVNLPASPWDGEIFEWINGAAGAFTTGNTVVTTDGSTIQGANTTGALPNATSIEFRYSLVTNTWYRMR